MSNSIWQGATVLVTGGTGSFGHAFARYILTEPIAALRVLSRDEFKQSEMAKRFTDPRVKFFVGDVRDRDRLMRAFAGVHVVVHAAAMKQVPACEYDPLEAVKTNILGAANVIDAAIERGVWRVMALSTDKACNPVNLYGATKLTAEKLFLNADSYVGGGHTRFAVVRYGNVVGSRGSIVPLLLEQSRTGADVTLTDVRMTRFWITLGHAVALITQWIAEMQGGELFIPSIPSVRIVDLIEAIAPGSAVKVIGIRPGEKLHEALIGPDEARARGLGAAYTSDTNDEWLDVAQIRAAFPNAMKEATFA